MKPHSLLPPKVSVRTLAELFGLALPLAVDDYQRSYVWGPDKVLRLLQDLQHYENARHEGTPDYYLGTILLHCDEARRCHFIVDGQQRLSTLAILYRYLHGALPQGCQLRFKPTAAENLRRAFNTIVAARPDLSGAIFQRLHCTVITVANVDHAFTFFDTQNNRGVPLATTDLLKAYHLRAIPISPHQRRFQTACAAGWEQLQKGTEVLGSGDDLAPTLFGRFLWRGRRWRGTGDLPEGERDALLQEFQEETLPPNGDGSAIPLYHTNANTFGKNLRLLPGGAYELQPHPLSLRPEPVHLPLALRQPVTAGVGFFLYVEKYAALLRRLFDAEDESVEVREFGRFYSTVWSRMSIHLQEIFVLVSLMYLDHLSDEGLLEFALWLDYSLGAERIFNSSVRWQTARKFLRDHHGNLLDVVAGAFTPRQVLRVLQNDPRAASVYREEKVPCDGKVQGRYKRALLTYFSQPEGVSSLAERRAWTESALRARQLKPIAPCQ